MKENKTSITLKNCYGEYSISVPETDLTIVELFEGLINPILLAAGYAQSTIDDYLKG